MFGIVANIVDFEFSTNLNQETLIFALRNSL